MSPISWRHLGGLEIAILSTHTAALGTGSHRASALTAEALGTGDAETRLAHAALGLRTEMRDKQKKAQKLDLFIAKARVFDLLPLCSFQRHPSIVGHRPAKLET